MVYTKYIVMVVLCTSGAWHVSQAMETTDSSMQSSEFYSVAIIDDLPELSNKMDMGSVVQLLLGQSGIEKQFSRDDHRRLADRLVNLEQKDSVAFNLIFQKLQKLHGGITRGFFSSESKPQVLQLQLGSELLLLIKQQLEEQSKQQEDQIELQRQQFEHQKKGLRMARIGALLGGIGSLSGIIATIVTALLK